MAIPRSNVIFVFGILLAIAFLLGIAITFATSFSIAERSPRMVPLKSQSLSPPIMSRDYSSEPMDVNVITRIGSATSTNRKSLVSSMPPHEMWLSLRDSSLSEGERNSRLNALRSADESNAIDEIWDMVQDRTLSDKWRGYCIQHLAEYHIEHRDNSSIDLLLLSADEQNPEIRESSVFSLARIVYRFGDSLNQVHTDKWHRVLSINLSKNAPVNVRVAAIRGISLTIERNYLPVLIEIAQDTSEDTHLRKAALDAIGFIGDIKCVELLSDLSSSSSKALRESSNRALKRLLNAASP